MIDYWIIYHERLFIAFIEHLKLVLISLIISIFVTIIIILIVGNKNKILQGFIYFFSTLYAIPSYAFFALLIPFLGLGTSTAVIVLSLYSIYILLRTFSTGIKEIDPFLIETAVGMGMTGNQVFYKIQLPLATKSIFSGIKLATTSIISIATIAATINAGGLGSILFDGLRTQSLIKLAWGSLLAVLLCVILSFFLSLVEKLTLKKLGLEEL
ncbi:ABC transporter permease subunit [Erwinia sp. CPCC 100877]|nr:ABC transporter permease subunit [Erwinia sp. CPCC 100877]